MRRAARVDGNQAAIRHKFNASPSTRDGIRFDSKKEAAYYEKLKAMVAAGDVVFFLRQVRFDLPGGVKYYCDFQVFLSAGDVEFVDVKGYRTKEYLSKKKMVEAIYPIKIKEV